TQSLLQRYVEAWQAADIGRLAALLKREVVMTMPPLPVRYDGRETVIAFLTTTPPTSERDRFRFVPTRANRQPALAVYRRYPPGQVYRAWAIFVHSADGDAVAEITVFADATLMPAFGLPAELGPDSEI